MTDDNKILRDYLTGLRACIDEISTQDVSAVAEAIYQAYLAGGQVFIFGNGGSAATASHFARDLSIGAAVPGKPRIKAVSLTDSVAAITSIANDKDYESIFVEQLVGQVKSGDMVIGISASGNSPNVLKGVAYARKCGAFTIAFIGFGGGKLIKEAEITINLSSHDYGQVEDMHLALEHMVTKMVRERMGSG